jgi:hypothetical protein
MQDNEHFIFFNKNIENSSLTKSIFLFAEEDGVPFHLTAPALINR